MSYRPIALIWRRHVNDTPRRLFRLTTSGVGVEKGLVVDLARGLHCRTVGCVRVSGLSGDRRRPCCWRDQESNQAFDVLGGGGQEELLLNELQPAQAETL